MSRLFAAALGIALTLATLGPVRAASKIEEIVSPGGIKAWLVRDRRADVSRLICLHGGPTPTRPQACVAKMADRRSTSAVYLDAQASRSA